MVLSISPHPSVGPLWFRRLWWCLISASAPCVSYLNIRLGSKTTGGFYLLFICLLACELLIFYRLFIYLIIYLFMFAIYLFGTCVYSLLSFRWFPFSFVFTANNNRCYFIFIFHSQCKTGSEESKWIDQLVVKHVLGGGLGSATSNITPQWWQKKVILNFHFLIARHWWSSQ